MAARKKSTTTRTARKSSGSASKSAGAKKAPAKKSGAKKAGASKKASAKKATRSKAAPAKAAPRKKATRKKAARKASPASRASAAAVKAPVFPEIEALAALMDTHGLLEVSYEREADGSTAIHVVRGGAYDVAPSAPAAFAAPAPAPAPVVAAPAAAPTEAAPAAPAPAADETLHAFKSPMVGTFYRASSPEAAPFATAGDSVDGNSVVCIIEAMKVMNEITPDVTGEVVSIEVENGEAVEFGQTLMLLRTR